VEKSLIGFGVTNNCSKTNMEGVDLTPCFGMGSDTT